MVAAEVLLGAEVEIVMVFGVEHSFNRCNGRNADGPRRQADIFIGVVRRLDFLVAVEHAADAVVVPGEDEGGVGL